MSEAHTPINKSYLQIERSALSQRIITIYRETIIDHKDLDQCHKFTSNKEVNEAMHRIEEIDEILSTQ